MREVWILRRKDGVTELSPRIAPLHVADRWLVIFTVVIASGAFFLTGTMPAPVLLAVIVACFAGEVVLGAKAVLLALLRPPAEVLEVPRFSLRRGSGNR